MSNALFRTIEIQKAKSKRELLETVDTKVFLTHIHQHFNKFLKLLITTKVGQLVGATMWFSACWGNYNHPGQGTFLEFGYANNHSPYGYEVHVPYGVPKLVLGDFTWEGFRGNWDLFQWGGVKFGPMASYNFTPYGGDELAKLRNMERQGFVEWGGLATVELPFGQLFLHCGKAPQGMIYKVALGTGVPLVALHQNHVWLNLLLEYGYYDSGMASYLFGVKPSEERAERSAYQFANLTYLSAIWGLWTPLSTSWWFNVTYKFDNFSDKILRSPIISRDWDATLMVGVMYSFGKLGK